MAISLNTASWDFHSLTVLASDKKWSILNKCLASFYAIPQEILLVPSMSYFMGIKKKHNIRNCFYTNTHWKTWKQIWWVAFTFNKNSFLILYYLLTFHKFTYWNPGWEVGWVKVGKWFDLQHCWSKTSILTT